MKRIGRPDRRRAHFAGVMIVVGCAAAALAQETPDVLGPGSPRPTMINDTRDLPGPTEGLVLSDNGLPHILLTGYWPPTNEMLRQWSPDPNQNLAGWVGEDWEGRGYNVYAFFPEFPGGTGANPKGDGDFEVDYQDTSNDWWPLVNLMQPIAIVTTSRANTSNGWELEGGNRNYSANLWSNDYLDPFKPTPELPGYDEPSGTTRYSSQPIDAIVAAVAASGADVDPFSTTVDTGRFLSNYIGYHGNWYKELHDDPNDPARCYTGGHIHVGRYTVEAEATLAMEVTLRVVIDHMNALRFPVGDLNCDGFVNFGDIDPFVLAITDPTGYVFMYPHCPALNADTNGDALVNFGDIDGFVALITGE